MRHSWLLLAVVVLLTTVLVAHGRRDDVREHSKTIYVFGTLVEIVVLGQSPDRASRAVAAVTQDFQRIHDAWHAWRPGELERLNTALAASKTAVVGDELAQVLRRAQELASASDGLFEPAIGGIVEAWGFHADTLPTGPPPSTAAIERWTTARPAMTDVTIDGNRISSSNAAVQLDLGAFAKGVALDLAADRLSEMDTTDAVLNAGGSIRVLGTHHGRPWRVAIRDPLGWGIMGALELRPGEALHTSGNYERYLAHAGERFSHVIDPRTGRPVEEIVSASVLSTDGALADAAATALSVAGPEGWRAIARRMGVATALLIDAQGHLHATPAMRARLELEPAGASIVADATALPTRGRE